MNRKENDPRYLLHEEGPSERELGRPRTSAAEQEYPSGEDENSPQQVNIRENMDAAPPSEVRRTREEHGTDDLSGV